MSTLTALASEQSSKSAAHLRQVNIVLFAGRCLFLYLEGSAPFSYSCLTFMVLLLSAWNLHHKRIHCNYYFNSNFNFKPMFLLMKRELTVQMSVGRLT
jgi:hypothetical protein